MTRIASSLYITLAILLLSACSGTISDSAVGWTNIAELDRLIEIVLANDTEALRSSIRFTQTRCTFGDGLGGPPKCANGEAEGQSVEVLPILGPEGHFIRQEEIDSWDGIEVTGVYAAYTVSESAFDDPNYPSGTHAIVFINESRQSSITLQVVDGQIVRLDFGFELPPEIPADWVEEFLITPAKPDA
jgi:hypothetical protein